MTRTDIVTRNLASGATLTIPVFNFKGTNKSLPSIYVQSSVHGAEVQGYLVALLLIEYFAQHPPLGDVTIVPLANPYGANCKFGEYTLGRFDPSTGDNWNRNYLNLSCVKSGDQSSKSQIIMEDFVHKHRNLNLSELIPLFKQKMKNILSQELERPQAYHKKLNLQLQLMASQADVVIDLHCDTISELHIYSASYLIESAAKFNMPYVIEIPNKFAGALDEATFCPWLNMLEVYNALHTTTIKPHFESFTIELGMQEQINMKDAENQRDMILSYLGYRGICDINFLTDSSSITLCKLEDFVTIYAPVGGLIIDSTPLGIEVPTGEVLMHISNMFNDVNNLNGLVRESSYSLRYHKDCIPITKISSANVHEGMTLMKIMTNYEKLA